MKTKTLSKKIYFLALIVLASAVLELGVIKSAWAGETTDKKIIEVIELTNKERSGEGLSALIQNENLMLAAEEKARDMIVNDYFEHTSPSGKTPWYWIEKNNYRYHYAGENLAINFTDMRKQHQAWMQSSKHRKNILNPNYDEIGVSILEGVMDEKLVFVTVQMFGAQEQQLVSKLYPKIGFTQEEKMGEKIADYEEQNLKPQDSFLYSWKMETEPEFKNVSTDPNHSFQLADLSFEKRDRSKEVALADIKDNGSPKDDTFWPILFAGLSVGIIVNVAAMTGALERPGKRLGMENLVILVALTIIFTSLG